MSLSPKSGGHVPLSPVRCTHAITVIVLGILHVLCSGLRDIPPALRSVGLLLTLDADIDAIDRSNLLIQQAAYVSIISCTYQLADGAIRAALSYEYILSSDYSRPLTTNDASRASTDTTRCTRPSETEQYRRVCHVLADRINPRV